MKERIVINRKLMLVFLFLTIALAACNNGSEELPFYCSTRGDSSLFVADFDADTAGSSPAPTTPLHYGPPGASLVFQGGSGSVIVVDSVELGSKALKITRGQMEAEVQMVIGDNGDAPFNSGVYYIEFMAHGTEIPGYLIAGLGITIMSTTEQPALSIKLFDSAYHHREADTFQILPGAYDPSVPHFVHIELDLDERNYSICIDQEVIAANFPLLTQGFGELRSLRFISPAQITEAFDMSIVLDEIRITN
jgi:hypothetical protein